MTIIVTIGNVIQLKHRHTVMYIMSQGDRQRMVAKFKYQEIFVYIKYGYQLTQ